MLLLSSRYHCAAIVHVVSSRYHCAAIVHAVSSRHNYLCAAIVHAVSSKDHRQGASGRYTAEVNLPINTQPSEL